jgi:hypothetical protein
MSKRSEPTSGLALTAQYCDKVIVHESGPDGELTGNRMSFSPGDVNEAVIGEMGYVETHTGDVFRGTTVAEYAKATTYASIEAACRAAGVPATVSETLSPAYKVERPALDPADPLDAVEIAETAEIAADRVPQPPLRGVQPRATAAQQAEAVDATLSRSRRFPLAVLTGPSAEKASEEALTGKGKAVLEAIQKIQVDLWGTEKKILVATTAGSGMAEIIREAFAATPNAVVVVELPEERLSPLFRLPPTAGDIQNIVIEPQAPVGFSDGQRKSLRDAALGLEKLNDVVHSGPQPSFEDFDTAWAGQTAGQDTTFHQHSYPQGYAAQVLETVRNRGSDYGTPADNHQLTADLTSNYLRRKLNLPVTITAEDVCMFNILQKVSRLAYTSKDDSYLDIAGYVENVSMLRKDQRTR